MRAGTTQEQWDEYAKEVERHKVFIGHYKFFLNRITDYLDWQGKRLNKASWTTEEIQDWVGSEIKQSESMDAPNEPGYYRANND